MYYLQRATKRAYPPLQVKQYTPPAQIKHTLQNQPGIAYAQIIKQIFYVPTNIEQEPYMNQSHQQISDMQDVKT
jgi:hypothetical protein